MTLCRVFDPLSFDPVSFDPVSFDPGSFDPLSVNQILVREKYGGGAGLRCFYLYFAFHAAYLDEESIRGKLKLTLS